MLKLDAMFSSINAPLTALAAFVAFQVVYWVYEFVTTPAEQKNARKLRTLPGSLPFFHDTFTILRNAHRLHDFMAEDAKTGNGVPTRWKILGRPPIIELVTPQQVEDVQKTHFDCFIKGEYQQFGLRDLLGNGIFIADGDNWVHQRKTAVNLFTTRMLRESMGKTVYRLMGIVHSLLYQAKDANKPVNVFRLLNRFTIQAFAEIGFGVDLNCLETVEDHAFQRAFDRSQQILTLRFLRPRFFWRFQRWANLGIEAELKDHLKVINDLVFDIIFKSLAERNRNESVRRSTGETRMDIISLFLDSQKTLPDGTIEPFDPMLLRDITLSFLGAARDTTAVSLSWFFYVLTEHPEVECKLRQEMWSKLPELMQGKITAPSMDQLQDLVYLEAVVKETMRLHPPVPHNTRMCSKSVVLSDGTYVPAGCSASMKNYTLGRMVYIWGPEAEEFKPERWIDETTGKLKAASSFQFNIFHGGPRICIGMNLALTQIKMVATSVLSQFHFERVSKEPINYEMTITLMMKDPFMVHVRPAASFV